MAIRGIPYHENQYVEGRWVCICPRCGERTPAARDPDDPEALRLSAKTLAHWRTHEERCVECGDTREEVDLTPLLACPEEDCDATVCDDCMDSHRKNHAR